MKNLAFLLLFLALFIACNSNSNSVSEQKEEKLPVNPTQWLSQIKNEEAKKRTTDVLEKIYISSAYSVLEKDSLSEMQVKFANCEVDMKMFNGWKAETYRGISEGRSKDAYSLLAFYLKDTAVFKAALNVIVDTSFLYIGEKPYPSYYYKGRYNNPEKLSTIKPSKELLDKEQEIISLLDSSRNIKLDDSDEEEKQQREIRKLASEKLFQLLKEPIAYDYVLPKLDRKLHVLYSPNKRFRIFYVPKYASFYEGGYDADVYIQYRESENSKLIVDKIECREVNEHNYCNPMFPAQIFQVEKNGNPVFIILHEYNGSMAGERYAILQAIEIKDEKAIPCKDCIEGEELKIYGRSSKMGSYPIFDTQKQRLNLISYPLIMTESIHIIKRYVLQWDGQQFVSIPLKLYCEE